MPDDNQNNRETQPDGSKSPTPKELEIDKALKNLSEKVDQSKVVSTILQDPDVQKVLKAKADGQKLKIEFVEDASAETDPFESFLSESEQNDVESMSNVDMLKEIKALVTEAVTHQVGAAIKPLQDDFEVGKVEAQNQALRKSILDAQEAYGDDFASRRDDMVKLSQNSAYAGLNAIDLYRIVSHDALVESLQEARKSEAADLDSERPSFFSDRKTTELVKARPGRRGFEQMIDDVYHKKG